MPEQVRMHYNYKKTEREIEIIKLKHTDSCEVAVIGGGPGGFAAAVRSAQLGMKTVLIARKDLAGISLRRSRLPTMSLIESAHVIDISRQASAFGLKQAEPKPDWPAVVKRARTVSNLISKGGEITLAKWKAAVIKGSASLKDANHVKIATADGEDLTVEAENVVIATGAEPKPYPGVEFERGKIISPREVIDLDRIPRRVLIIGGNAISLEFAYVFQAMDSQVTIVESRSGILEAMDEDIIRTISRIFKQRGIRIQTSSRLTGIDRSRDVWHYFIDTGEGPADLYADICIVNIGRVASVKHLGLESLGMELDEGFIAVDDHMRTSIPGIYAVGDCAGPPLLAQAALLEGACAAETMAGQESSGISYENMPSCIYCHPEVATVGISEETAAESGYDFKIGKSYFSANDRAVARGMKDGLVKLIVNRDTERILGAHVVGTGAPELIGQIVIGRKLDMTAGVLAGTSQPHPSLSEAFTEAANAVTGKSVFG